MRCQKRPENKRPEMKLNEKTVSQLLSSQNQLRNGANGKVAKRQREENVQRRQQLLVDAVNALVERFDIEPFSDFSAK